MASLASLLIQETKAQIYARGLAVAAALGINTTSWAPGDPTRSLYYYLAEVLESLEKNVAGYVASGFLDYASGDWLTLLAKQLYGVDRVGATFASTTVTLRNRGGGHYVIAPGDVVVKSSTTGKTYTTASGGTLASGSILAPTSIVLDVIADEAGADSSASTGEIDTLVTALLGVDIIASPAALGIDEEGNAALRDRCRASLGMLSPDGPRDAYDFVVRTPALTGVTEITRSRTTGDSTTGDVVVYVAGAAGPVPGAAVTAAQAAVEQWATPLCITPSVHNCVATNVFVTYELWLYSSVGQSEASVKSAVADAITAMLAARPIGGDVIAPSATGALYQSLIVATIRGAFPDQAFRVAVSVPSGDTTLAVNAVPLLGAPPTATIHFESNP